MRASLLKRFAFLGVVFAVGSSFAFAQKSVSHCVPNFTVDIGPNMVQPDGSFQTVSGDCTGTDNCQDYFDLTCAGGETVTATYCSNGGAASFDTALATFDAGDNVVECNDDNCGLLSELVFTALPFQRVKIDAFGNQSGTYTLAFQAPATCTIAGAVPVELVSFTGTANGMDVSLNWETASETNNAGFEVQIQHGDHWDILSFVDGHGTTTEAQTYSFDVGEMAVGTHAFRLKQIDFDGAFEYSDEVEVTVETPGTHLISSAYPNPFNPQSQFTLAVAQEQHVTAELFNTLGQRVAVLFEGTVEANQSQLVTIDGAGLASGTYVVRVNGERFSDALSVTLLK